MRPSLGTPLSDRRWRRPIRDLAIGFVATILAFTLTACGDAIDPRKTEIAIQYDVEEATGAKVAQVTCPEGIEVETGRRFSCRVVTVEGDAAIAELAVTNESADLRLIRLRKP